MTDPLEVHLCDPWRGPLWPPSSAPLLEALGLGRRQLSGEHQPQYTSTETPIVIASGTGSGPPGAFVEWLPHRAAQRTR